MSCKRKEGKTGGGGAIVLLTEKQNRYFIWRGKPFGFTSCAHKIHAHLQKIKMNVQAL